ncbi:uncharacterized protein [Glycine max]|uniref:uncharacterized protein n=1 Tax=Glycine max TaxID=3847 RepID=UPI00071925CB|nr:uncharacterized protein LOC106798831 [Glycine max]|eukprot:XP_014631492.1 uncharacterized protein LOC106798831 [Glycine max]
MVHHLHGIYSFAMVQMVRNQQNQLHSFASRHKFLEDHLRMQHEGWVSDVRRHKDQISQMNGMLTSEEKKRSLEAAKADFAMGLKHTEAAIAKYDPKSDLLDHEFMLKGKWFQQKDMEKSFQDLLRKQEGDRSVWEYPFVFAGVNITFMLIQMLDLEAVTTDHYLSDG